MQATFTAIYENGVLKPLEPVNLKEHQVVSLSVVGQEDPGPRESSQAIDRQKAALAAMLEETAALPAEGPADAFSNRDHDLALYGWRK
jgi:predicted DNA-binding antitoxin AbrB/MazE fold protein